MLSAFGRAFRTPDLRRKLLFTIAIMALFRVGSFIPAPGVDYANVQQCAAVLEGSTSLLGLVNTFSGGALLQLSIFALGIMPYITASIIVQLLRVVIPRFEALHKEGQSGQSKLTQYTRYLTIALAVLQSTTIITTARTGLLFPGCGLDVVVDDRFMTAALMVLTMTAVPAWSCGSASSSPSAASATACRCSSSRRSSPASRRPCGRSPVARTASSTSPSS